MGDAEANGRETPLNRNNWPDLVYRLVEHYKWEPQHLLMGESADSFYENIRRHEVPLTFLFQILLRLTSSKTISALLKEFAISGGAVADDEWRLLYPEDAKFTQPDAWIESDRSRVFIEIKVVAPLRVEQVQKYLLLHAQQDFRDGQKRPYLFFLTASDFVKCWRPQLGTITPNDIQAFLRSETAADLPKRLQKLAQQGGEAERYDAVKQDVTYGTATWASFGQALEAVCSRLKQDGANDVEISIINDFLHELRIRKLWAPLVEGA